FSLLRPGGVLVAVCLNGPRQQEKLLPFSDVREELPRGTFAYTSVPTMIIVMFRGTHLHRNFHAISIPVFV
ncbi:TPA: hypothetical protein ACGTRB_004924, partial [Escherichia coli]